MSILVDHNSKVICQGLTGAQGTRHTEGALAYGTQVVAGVTPGKGGTQHLGLPVYDSVEAAAGETNADVSVIYVPAPLCMDAICEASKAESIKVIVVITEGIPVQDMILAKKVSQYAGKIMIGPNCPGIITPPSCKIGIMPGSIFSEGKVGIVSRSGTLTYEAVKQTTDAGLGQSTCVGIGGDPIPGSNFVDVLKMFNDDPQTEAIVMVGEIGGNAEQDAAEYIADNIKVPVVGYIAGSSAPPGRRMGHAGAVVSGSSGTASAKFAVMREAGIHTVDTPDLIGETLVKVLGKN